MAFEGYLDSTTPTEIAGWVYLNSQPDSPVAVEIVADGKVIATLDADVYRSDLLDAAKGNGCHAFSFKLPENEPASSRLQARVAGQPWYIQLGTEAYSRSYAFMQHSCEYGFPEAPYGFSEIPAADLTSELPLIERLLNAYHASTAAIPGRPNDMWTDLEGGMFPDFINLVHQRNAPALAEYMRSFFGQTISHGTFQGTMATTGLENPNSARYVAAFIVDSLAALAEAIGILRVENPEQGHYGENLFRDPEELLDLLQSHLHIDPVPPNAAGRKFGMRTRRGILALTDLRALYAANRIHELTAGDRTICEIGGGIGLVAYYSQLLGVDSYTIIDIPAISFMQGYWLSRALPSRTITLYGEQHLRKGGIRLLPPSEFTKSQYGLVYNQDSFPEMHRDHSRAYLRDTPQLAPLLLSINQEGEAAQTASTSQPVVADLISEVGSYRRLYRFHNWLRAGYVEELYLTQAAIDPASPIFQGTQQTKAHRALDYALTGQWSKLGKNAVLFLKGQ